MNAAFRPRTQKLPRPSPSLAQKPADVPIAPKAPKGNVDSPIEFAAMEIAYARHGGLLCANEVIQQMRHHWEQPISVLAKWIVSGTMIKVDWNLDILIPMFQFDPRSLGPRPGCREIVAELKDVMSDWEMACWFATSNPWLGGLAPIDMLTSSWDEVFQAARGMRFVLRG